MSSQIAASKPKDDGSKKYLKRSEIEAQRQADYLKEQEDLEKARLERLDKKRKRDEEGAEQKQIREEKRRRLAEESRKHEEQEREDDERDRRKRLGLPELVKEESRGETPLTDDEQDLGEEELLAKLQEMGEPRKLFGETHVQRLRRYRNLTAKGLAPVMSKGPISTTMELLPEAEMKVSDTVPKDEKGVKYLHRQIASYFDMLLSEWQSALARRPKEVKESFAGKQAYNNHTATLSNLKLLFTQLESHTLPSKLLTPIHEIVQLAQQRKYVSANDAYLRLSIGKAAWPIGVTMVGIHERSAREKLHGGETAGILGDEGSRKMLQGIKRCLSFAQTRWPPEDGGQLMG